MEIAEDLFATKRVAGLVFGGQNFSPIKPPDTRPKIGWAMGLEAYFPVGILLLVAFFSGMGAARIGYKDGRLNDAEKKLHDTLIWILIGSIATLLTLLGSL